MGKKSKIGWTQGTFNGWRGCAKVSPGCANCYAEREDSVRHYTTQGWGVGSPRELATNDYWDKPIQWDREAGAARTRMKVFTASLSDVFDLEVPIEWLARLLELIRVTPNIDWLVLTKRIEHCISRLESAASHQPASSALRDWIEGWLSGWPPANLWMGTSVEDQKRMDDRIFHLLTLPAARRWLSLEPLIGPVTVSEFLGSSPLNPWLKGARIDWLVVGGESGPLARPLNPAWVDTLVAEARLHKTPLFFKQWGEFAPPDAIDGFDESQFLESGGEMILVPGQDAVEQKMFRVGTVRAGMKVRGQVLNEFPKPVS
jgi:protein gp37